MPGPRSRGRTVMKFGMPRRSRPVTSETCVTPIRLRTARARRIVTSGLTLRTTPLLEYFGVISKRQCAFVARSGLMSDESVSLPILARWMAINEFPHSYTGIVNQFSDKWNPQGVVRDNAMTLPQGLACEWRNRRISDPKERDRLYVVPTEIFNCAI